MYNGSTSISSFSRRYPKMSQYTAEDIEVLTGLEPVRKRPGMYTDTTRPNHLAQEVIDNSVDEALAGSQSASDARNGAGTTQNLSEDLEGESVLGIPGDLSRKPGAEGNFGLRDIGFVVIETWRRAEARALGRPGNRQAGGWIGLIV